MLELKNLSFQVEDEKEIIKNVNLTVDDHIVVITGPNGGGKSTLAKIIAGLVTPTDGQILLNGKDITNMSVTQHAKEGISFAFQQPVRFKGLTVKDLITVAAGKGDDGKEISLTDACGYLSEVGLCAKDYINRELDDSLSGGEIKRIEIAMILARGTELSIFDEPEAGIDLWSFSNLIHVFEKMQKKNKGTIIIISHQERILDIADKILYIKDGCVVKYGKKDEILPEILGNTASAGCDVLMNKLEGRD